MTKSEFKRGLIITLIISIIIIIPRILKIEQLIIKNLLFQFIYIYVLNFIYLSLSQFFTNQNWGIFKTLSLYFLLCGFLSIGYHLIFTNFIFQFKLLDKDIPLFYEMNLKKENLILFIRGLLFSGIIYFIIFYFKLFLEKQKNLLEIEHLRKERLESQLNSLKQQISPHFLFNSLTTLRSITEDKASKVFINKLSNVYRYLLNINENNLISLQEELEFTDSYLYIIKERFEDAIIIKKNIPTDIENKKIPPLSIQLLVENAIKHNEVSINNPLTINIFLSKKDEIVVSNNIQLKKSTEISTGQGLNNINHRYEILSQKKITIFIVNQTFIVKLPLL